MIVAEYMNKAQFKQHRNNQIRFKNYMKVSWQKTVWRVQAVEFLSLY